MSPFIATPNLPKKPWPAEPFPAGWQSVATAHRQAALGAPLDPGNAPVNYLGCLKITSTHRGQGSADILDW